MDALATALTFMEVGGIVWTPHAIMGFISLGLMTIHFGWAVHVIKHGVEHVARHDRMAVDVDGLLIEQTGDGVCPPLVEVTRPAQRLVPERLELPFEGPGHGACAAAGHEGLHLADVATEVDRLVVLGQERGDVGALAFTDEVSHAVVLVGEPGDVEGE